VSKKIFIFGDYSQAEARVVAYAGPVQQLKEWFKQGVDVHLETAREIGKTVHEKKIQLPKNLFLRKRPEDYAKDDEERDLSKQTVYGNNYGQGAEKFSIVTGLPEVYAKVLQGIYHTRFPEIKGGYQRWIREQVDNTKTLRTPFGGRIVFYDIINEDLYREAYAWFPQNIVGYLTSRWYSLNTRIFKDYKEVKVWTPTNLRSCGLDQRLQVHDSVGVVVDDDPSVISYAVKLMRENATQPCVLHGDNLIIPVDFKIGYNWGDLKDYKEN
jgi:hypothetical protein